MFVPRHLTFGSTLTIPLPPNTPQKRSTWLASASCCTSPSSCSAPTRTGSPSSSRACSSASASPAAWPRTLLRPTPATCTLVSVVRWCGGRELTRISHRIHRPLTTNSQGLPQEQGGPPPVLCGGGLRGGSPRRRRAPQEGGGRGYGPGAAGAMFDDGRGRLGFVLGVWGRSIPHKQTNITYERIPGPPRPPLLLQARGHPSAAPLLPGAHPRRPPQRG